MRIFTFLLTLFILNSAAFAQVTEIHDSARIDVKSERMPKSKIFNTWDVGIHGGMTIPNTDIAASDFNGDNVQQEIGYGLHLTKFITHSFALQAQFIRAKLSGIDTNKPLYRYNTDIDYDITLNAFLQVGNIAFLKRTPNLALYGYIGVGFMRFSPHVSIDGGKNKLTGIYSEYTEPLDTMDYQSSTELVIPFGAGIKYRIAKRFSITGEYSLRTTNSDKLDGWFKHLSENDVYSYFNLGLTYHIGRKEKMVEWVNPLQSLYVDLYEMKDKVDRMGVDTDNDGVADYFDREPETPEGIKVYGDGTSVDSDGDGVPDILDVEPFTAKGVKVDASGREIDTDGDGIPDSRDLEPGTPKGTLVNNEGITIPTGSKRGGAGSVFAANGYLPSIFFDVNSDVIHRKYNETLASIALVMRNNPDVKFMITGNCDSRASVEYNIALGNRRANAVKNHLVQKYNIDPSRLQTQTLGKGDPITGAHPMNRRVDFSVTE